jgi:hypothetical protein
MASGTRIELTFDSRLYAPLERPVVTIGARAVAASSEISEDRGSGASTCTVTLAEPVPASRPGGDRLVLLVGTARPLYPHDLVRAPLPAAVEVPATTRTPRAARELRARRGALMGATASPWGFELTAGWDVRTWGPGQRFKYYYPAQVTMRSVGPGAAPRGASFTIGLDPQQVHELTVAAVRLNGKPHRGSVHRVRNVHRPAVYETQWRISAALKAEDVFDIVFRVSLKTPTGALPTIKHPVVELDALSTDPMQRVTGAHTVSRADSVWE